MKNSANSASALEGFILSTGNHPKAKDLEVEIFLATGE